jgi:hypothetical protein
MIPLPKLKIETQQLTMMEEIKCQLCICHRTISCVIYMSDTDVLLTCGTCQPHNDNMHGYSVVYTGFSRQ